MRSFLKNKWMYLAMICLFLLYVKIDSALINWQDSGQLIKFLLFDVLVVNSIGILYFFIGICIVVFSTYMIATKKAVNPKGVVLPAILLSAIFLTLGGLMSHNSGSNIRDVGSFLTGNVREETVVITGFHTYVTSEGHLYTYTLDDGRTFDEIYRGEGFSQIQEGGTYFIRYLPRSKKLLRIEAVGERGGNG